MSFMAPIRKHLTTEILKGRAATHLTDDDELLTSGLVDSLGIVHLVNFIEDEFGVKVPFDEITIENFGTLRALDEYLVRRAGA